MPITNCGCQLSTEAQNANIVMIKTSIIILFTMLVLFTRCIAFVPEYYFKYMKDIANPTHVTPPKHMMKDVF